ncbi:hypothetical protein [Kitasatospora herbaricolor]|uniref:hypothetical protein n=1 Tax=Kitasatospora herbaricolor TaxID=68217 RepID=UPI0036DC17B7
MYGVQERVVVEDGALPSNLAAHTVRQVLAQADLQPGNMGAATLPLQLALATEHGRLWPGTQIALFWLASGAGVMLVHW